MNLDRERIARVIRIYMHGRRMNIGRAGDGDMGREYRVRFVQHIVAGAQS